MFRIQNVKLPYRHREEMLKKAAAGQLHIDPEDITSLKILRRSYDCRSKPKITAVYTLLVSCRQEARIRSRLSRLKNVSEYHETVFQIIPSGNTVLHERPLIIGSGPAGLFCALELARAGYRPIIAERGKPVEERRKDVERFWKEGVLDPNSNIQFGEGGAGTFSDGKLSTGVTDKDGRCRKVLQEFVRFGADPDILIDSHPHVGTDVLSRILVQMRREIEEAGGSFLFRTCADDIRQETPGIIRVHFSDGTSLNTQVMVLAIGNGAQDTFRMLDARRIRMESKSFAVGFRVEHPQEWIDANAYGEEALKGFLPPASYKLTAHAGGRGIYSFCMCPGGYVVNAASVPGQTVVNGMSYSGRDGKNANAAIVMTVTPADFGTDAPLGALEYQTRLERAAFSLCGGAVPQQRLGDFRDGIVSTRYGRIVSQMKGQHAFADLSALFTEEMKAAMLAAFEIFERRIPGFGHPDAVLSAIESRTSSPVRIPRNETGVCSCAQIYPCGEGPGYAGGICSAAMDGLKTAQIISSRYKPMKEA